MNDGVKYIVGKHLFDRHKKRLNNTEVENNKIKYQILWVLNLAIPIITLQSTIALYESRIKNKNFKDNYHRKKLPFCLIFV